jgi:uncharacterized protein YndB with AHSA1/START domain
MVLPLVILLAIVVAILAYASTRPAEFRIERSATMNAPPDRVFAAINDFRNWLAWSPWEKLDPALRRTHSGSPSGRGAIYEWEGNKKVGKGRMEITESTPPSKVLIRLDFIKPFESHNTAEFRIEPQGTATQVTWTMNGKNQFMGKLMGLFMNMDRMIGKDFEAGLANLRGVVERG